MTIRKRIAAVSMLTLVQVFAGGCNEKRPPEADSSANQVNQEREQLPGPMTLFGRHDPADQVADLIEQYPELPQTGEHPAESYLWQAAKFGRARSVSVLMEHNPSHQSRALEVAIQNGQTQTVTVLWHHGARSEEALHYAAAHNQAEIAQALIDAGVPVDHRAGGLEDTALGRAAMSGNPDVVQVLLARRLTSSWSPRPWACCC